MVFASLLLRRAMAFAGIEISQDDKQFRQVAERKQQFDKWKANFPPTNARYVRLTDLNAAAFHLSEVEIY